MTTSAVAYATDKQNQQRFLDELKDLIRIPSVSTLPQHKGDVQRAAQFIADDLKRMGMENVAIIPTAGHPLVYADWMHASGKPTALCYGHYDVQPPDPLEEWVTPPFEPTIRNGNLHARGAVDDKGQMHMHLKALESLLQAGHGKLPVNVKVLIEGEEEVGGESIAKFVKENSEKLRSDFALISDTEMFAPDLPTLNVGLRGLIYTEIEAQGAKIDLHSGQYGGVAPNPFFALCQIISRLKDENGLIQIPHIYDKVRKPGEAELTAWASLPFDEKSYRENEIGSKELTGEPGLTVQERTWSRPTLEVHGMPGGFTGAGAKTVIPARAVAKVSMRIVPDMKPDEVVTLYTDFVMSLAPKGVVVKVRVLSMGEPSIIPTDNRFIKAATEALKDVFHKETVFIRSGGSIPIVAEFQKHLNIPSVMMGFGLPDDNLHAPNEKFHIANYYRGIESIVRFLERLGA
ncbi:MAG: dipeptidase [Acidobacteriales bacterium]|nr:dipeptidase [Terriglobales bacterium]